MTPAPYTDLDKETGPKMLVEGRPLIGILEAPGKANNPTLLGWAEEVGLKSIYSADSIAWCGLFMAVVAHRAGKTLPVAPLWARNWGQFGVFVKPQDAMLGDVLVFARGDGGHVGMYVGEDPFAFHVLGGNQRDSVCITRMERSRLITARRPVYTHQPANVRRILRAASGKLSTNEA